MKNKVKVEKLLFILLNIFFIPEVYVTFFIIISLIIALILSSNIQKNFLENIFNYFSKGLYICAFFYITFAIIKILIFPIIYIKNNSYIKKFFNKLLTDSKFMYKILLITFLIDIIHFIKWHNPILIFVGLFINYLIFLIIFPPKSQKIPYSDNSQTVISNYSKIMFTIIFILDLLILIGFYCYIKIKAF